MTTFHIKLLAILTMIIDHLGLFFFPKILLFRIIGRLSYPLFAWLIANGAYHTHDINAYLKRLFIFACIAEVPFILANRQLDLTFWYLNALFTLFLGCFAIKIIKQTKDKKAWIGITLICSLAAVVLKTDYSAAGVLSVISFFLFFKDLQKLFISQIIILSFLPLFFLFAQKTHLLPKLPLLAFIEPFGILSLVFIAMYNNKLGPKTKYLFYIFYPVQYVVILFLQLFIKVH